jgi:hypothetical protein
MALPDIAKKLETLARSHSPALLTVFGVTGTITTAYLTGRAAFQASDDLRIENNMRTVDAPELTLKDKTTLTWRLYVPAMLSGTATVTCIVGANRIGNRRAAALMTAFSLSDRAFHEYRDKVVETIGKGKEQKVRDDVLQDRVNEKPPSKEVIITGPGTQLCYEAHTGRYFNSDMETLRKAVNNVNSKLLRHDSSSMADFYDHVGLDYPSSSWHIGWTTPKQLALEFSSVITDDGRTCLAFDYNYADPL